MSAPYSAALWVHVTAALVLVAAIATAALCEHAVDQATALGELRRWAAAAERCRRAIGAAALTLLVSGGVLVRARWHLTEPWLVAAIVAFVLAAASGVAEGRRMNAAVQLADGAGAVTPAVRLRLNDPLRRAHGAVRPFLLAWQAFLMTTKPTITGVFAGLLVVAALGAAVAASRRRATAARWSTAS